MKQNKTLVSILIINYNNAKYLKRAIQSCLQQTYNNVEILIFDDKSKDNSASVLRKFSKNKKIKIYFNLRTKKSIAAFDARNGYYYLFNKSKGDLICLLDSDDFFHKKKILEIVNFFDKNKKKNFLQNLPILLKENKKIFKMNLNSSLSFWPYLAPESCISFRRLFMKIFIIKNKIHKNKFPSVWLGFRLGIFSYFRDKSFSTINKNLTYYRSYGESKKYPIFGINWFARRLDSFMYLHKITNNKISNKFNMDYLITLTLVKLLNFLK